MSALHIRVRVFATFHKYTWFLKLNLWVLFRPCKSLPCDAITNALSENK